MIKIILFIIILFFVLTIVIGRLLSTRPYTGDKSDHFNGKRFKNPSGVSAKGFDSVFKYMMTRERDHGYGDDATATEECWQPDGLIITGGACDDTDATINPEAEDIVNNGIDEDCDGMDAVSSVSDLADIGVSIYPNPVNDLLYIQQDQNIQFNVTLFNTKGKRVLTSYFFEPLNTLDVTTLVSGVYYVRIMRKDIVVNFRKVVR